MLAEATAAIELINKAHKQGWLDRLVTAVRKKHRVLVLGSTGVGKTNFLTSLTESIPTAVDIMNRTEIAKKHRLKIQKSPFMFVDTPGQEQHKTIRLKAIREALASGISGVINVVSYGYHEYRTGLKEAVDDNGKVSDGFLSAHRKKETAALEEWTPLLGGPEAAGWLITVVTKADLWWNRGDEVLEHYRTGAYYAALGSAKSLHPIMLEYSSVFQKYFGKAPMSGDFEDMDRIRAKAHLIEELLAAVGKFKSG